MGRHSSIVIEVASKSADADQFRTFTHRLHSATQHTTSIPFLEPDAKRYYWD